MRVKLLKAAVLLAVEITLLTTLIIYGFLA